MDRLDGVAHWSAPGVAGFLVGAVGGQAWWAALIVVIVTTFLSLWVWDVRKKGGFFEWLRKMLALYKESGSVRTAVARERRARKLERLESKLERRRLRRRR